MPSKIPPSIAKENICHLVQRECIKLHTQTGGYPSRPALYNIVASRMPLSFVAAGEAQVRDIISNTLVALSHKGYKEATA